MGQAADRPDRQAVMRRALAGALALLANGAMIALVLLTPRTAPMPVAATVIDLVFIAAPEPESAPVTEAEASPPEIASIEPARAETAPETQPVNASEDQAIIIADGDDDEARPQDEPGLITADGFPDYGIITLPPLDGREGTSSVLRGIFCQTTSEATRDAGDCADDSQANGLSLMRYATTAANDEALQAALAMDLTPAQIRALFEGDGLPLNDLSGQPTLADTRQRATSSADQMRDSLPAQHPDPAFGD